MRDDPELDSQDAGIVRFDCDVLLHKYKVTVDKKSSRDLQCLMFVEVKTHSAPIDAPQRDTLSLMAQVVRNRRRNKHRDKRGRHCGDHDPLASAFSWLLGRNIRLRMFGGHLLRLSGSDPLDSERMTWDGKPITLQQLRALLRFELDPDSLQPIDWRRRYSSFEERTLFSSHGENRGRPREGTVFGHDLTLEKITVEPKPPVKRVARALRVDEIPWGSKR